MAISKSAKIEAEIEKVKTKIAEPEPDPEPTTDSEPVIEPVSEPEAESSTGPILLILAVALIGGGAAWYFKIYRPKHQASQPEEDYSDEDNGPPGTRRTANEFHQQSLRAVYEAALLLPWALRDSPSPQGQPLSWLVPTGGVSPAFPVTAIC